MGATGLISSSAGAGVGATVASAVVVPAPSFSFPPGLIPTLVEAKSRHSAMYAPLEVRDIEKAGEAGWPGGHVGGWVAGWARGWLGGWVGTPPCTHRWRSGTLKRLVPLGGWVGTREAWRGGGGERQA